MKFRVLRKIPDKSRNDNNPWFHSGEIIDLSIEEAAPLLEQQLIEHMHEPYAVQRLTLNVKPSGRG